MSNIDEFREKRLLGSIWAENDPEVRDYACNVFATEVAKWNIVKFLAQERGELDEEIEKGVEIIKTILKKRGEALFIRKHADILTQLGIKAPDTTKKVVWE